MWYSYSRGEHNQAFNRHIEKLSAAAKLTHTKYGNNNQPAAGTDLQNSIDVARIASHNMTISAKARPGDLSRKKRADHATLSNNCSRKSCIGPAINPTFRQTSHAAIAIATNKIVHTGPNSQLGGVQRGLLKSLYHGRSAGVVSNDPSPAAPRQTAMQTMSLMEDLVGL
jgi:hypothetical protein